MVEGITGNFQTTLPFYEETEDKSFSLYSHHYVVDDTSGVF